MSDLLNPRTASQINSFSQHPGHALILSAPEGSGKFYAAQLVAQKILNLGDLEKLASYPYFKHISRQKGKSDITVEQIQQVIDAQTLKTTGSGQIRRIVIIENAHFMNAEAQNRLLKTLEEPPADTLIILTAASQRSLLPTINSRCQVIKLLAVDLAATESYFAGKYSVSQIKKAYEISRGRPGLILAILHEDNEHPLNLAITQAKQLLAASKFERLCQLDSLSKDKESFYLLIEALSRIIGALHQAAIKKSQPDTAKRWLGGRQLLVDSKNALDHNAQTKLTALKLLLEL